MQSIHSQICKLATVEVEEILLKNQSLSLEIKTTLTIQSVLEQGFLCSKTSPISSTTAVEYSSGLFLVATSF